MQIPHHQPPPHQPHPGSQMSHAGLPMSPRNPPSALQGHSTPALSRTIFSPIHPPHPSVLARSSNSLLTSTSPTPPTPLQALENRWDWKATQVDQDSPELVERKVKGLLNKLTMEKFASISDQIIAWANKSEKEKDGRTLIQVVRLVFDHATDEATWSSEMYARLCRKMLEKISANVQVDGIKNNEGKSTTGGGLFRKYLLNRCQKDFERGWVAKEVTAVAAATGALGDKAANAKIVSFDEYYATQKAKRHGLGVIKFIGELFRLQILTERIVHECVKKLLGNVDNPEEEEIESLCKLLATVGSMLDIQKARGHVDVYFAQMKKIMKSPDITPRMQFMLQDLLELRERKWVARNAAAAPTTIAQIYENAAKEKASQEKESYQRQISMSRGGSRRGGDRGDFNNPQQQQVGPDGWAVAGSGSGPPRPPPKAGDLSNFGKISKTQPLTFGPSSVFAGKKGAENKREAISRTNSSSNMFSMLNSQGAEVADNEIHLLFLTLLSDKALAAPEPLPQRKRLVLQPRSVPVEATSPAAETEGSHSEEEASNETTEEVALKKISEDLKEFFAVRNLEEAEVYFSSLPPQHHHLLVDKIVSTAVESKEDDAKLVSQFFVLAASKGLCSAASFEQGLTPVAEIIDDIAIDAPKAFQLLAMMIQGASLGQERLANLASKSSDSDKFLALLQLDQGRLANLALKSLNSNMFSMFSIQGGEAGDNDRVPTVEPFPQRKRRSPEFTVQSLCIDPPYLNLASLVDDCPCPKKSDSSLATGFDELGKASPSGDPLLTSASPSVISLSSHGSEHNYEAEWLRIRLNAAQEDLRLQQRQFEEEKIVMNRHFEERQQKQRAQFDAERVFYQLQIKALTNYLRDEK